MYFILFLFIVSYSCIIIHILSYIYFIINVNYLILLLRLDYTACLRTVNDLLSQIPPYALYTSHRLLRSSRDSKSIYEHVYLQSDTDIGERIRTSWLQNLRFYKHMLYNINLPFAVRVELSVCDTCSRCETAFCSNFNAQEFENAPPTKSGFPGIQITEKPR